MTVALTAGAWSLRQRLSRRAAALESGEPGVSRVDGWLIRHHQPISLEDCYRVRQAVVTGIAVRDPALRPAAHGLAAELLHGRLRDWDTGMALSTAFYLFNGALAAGVGVAAHGPVALIARLSAVGWVAYAAACGWRVRPGRRTIEEALLLNDLRLEEPRDVYPGRMAGVAGGTIGRFRGNARRNCVARFRGDASGDGDWRPPGPSGTGIPL
jgi:hypothetical protein